MVVEAGEVVMKLNLCKYQKENDCINTPPVDNNRDVIDQVIRIKVQQFMENYKDDETTFHHNDCYCFTNLKRHNSKLNNNHNDNNNNGNKGFYDRRATYTVANKFNNNQWLYNRRYNRYIIKLNNDNDNNGNKGFYDRRTTYTIANEFNDNRRITNPIAIKFNDNKRVYKWHHNNFQLDNKLDNRCITYTIANDRFNFNRGRYSVPRNCDTNAWRNIVYDGPAICDFGRSSNVIINCSDPCLTARCWFINAKQQGRFDDDSSDDDESDYAFNEDRQWARCRPPPPPVRKLDIEASPVTYNGWAPMRIKTDYRFLRTTYKECRFAGEIVPIGNSSTNRSCSRLITNNCAYRCTKDDVPTDLFVRTLTSLVFPTAINILSRLLSVPVRDGNLFLDQDVWTRTSRQCSAGVYVPDEYVENHGAGVADADIVLFVTLRPLQSPSIASGLPCNFKVYDYEGRKVYGRPLAGNINISPGTFTKRITGHNAEANLRKLVQTAIHEILHVLGFSPGFYESFLDVDGKPHKNPLTRSMLQGVNPSGVKVSKEVISLSTPQVINAAKLHYGCDHAHGMELEELAYQGDPSAHWEQRIANTELMTSMSTPSMMISMLTVALLQDTGWYVVDPTLAQDFVWGKGKGCSFLTDRCESWAKDEGYFCDSFDKLNNRAQWKCTPDRRGKGYCSATYKNETLSPYNQHFSSPNLGGMVSADYCPFRQTVNNVNLTSELCTERDDKNRCFYFFDQHNNQRPECLTHRCTDIGNLQVWMPATGCFVDCPMDGGDIKFPRGGGFRCPPSSFFCSRTRLPEIVPAGQLIGGGKSPWWKSIKFWVPLTAAGVLLIAGAIVGSKDHAINWVYVLKGKISPTKLQKGQLWDVSKCKRSDSYQGSCGMAVRDCKKSELMSVCTGSLRKESRVQSMCGRAGIADPNETPAPKVDPKNQGRTSIKTDCSDYEGPFFKGYEKAIDIACKCKGLDKRPLCAEFNKYEPTGKDDINYKNCSIG
eukprot:gene12776-14991_t